MRHVPTDAEYAMDLISQRVARGEDINPKRRRYKSYHEEGADNLGVQKAAENSSPGLDWKKWGERAANTKAWTQDVRNIFKDGQVGLIFLVVTLN